MRRPIVINLYGGPNSGKSTTAYLLAGELKREGLKAELVTEYAKDMTWAKAQNVLEDQIYVFGKQNHRMWRLKDDVDYIVTDSPLITSEAYNKDVKNLLPLILEEYGKWKNLDVFLTRDPNPSNYQEYGRNHDFNQAVEVDKVLLGLLARYTPHFLRLHGKDLESVKIIINEAKKLKEKYG